MFDRIILTVEIDGFRCFLGEDTFKKPFLAYVGSDSENVTPTHIFTPSIKPPKENDSSSFARLYRVLAEWVNEKKTEGPIMSIPGTFMSSLDSKFQQVSWYSELPAEKLFSNLESLGFTLKIIEIFHTGDNAEDFQTDVELSKWIDDMTEVKSIQALENKSNENDDGVDEKLIQQERKEKSHTTFGKLTATIFSIAFAVLLIVSLKPLIAIMIIMTVILIGFILFKKVLR